VKAPDGLICVDAGWRPTVLARAFAALGLAPSDVQAVLLTHRHWDHAAGLPALPRARVFVGAGEDLPRADRRARTGQPWQRLADSQTTSLAGVEVQAIGTPGHTPGSASYVLGGRLLFTGDTVRLRRGRALPFPACFNRDDRALRASLRRLATLTGIERLLSAHTGAAHDVAAAFANWRDPAPATRPAGRASQ